MEEHATLPSRTVEASRCVACKTVRRCTPQSLHVHSLSSLFPVSSWPSNGASGVRVRVRLRVILKYVVADALNYAKAPDPFGGQREMAMARASLVRSSLAWLHVCSRRVE